MEKYVPYCYYYNLYETKICHVIDYYIKHYGETKGISHVNNTMTLFQFFIRLDIEIIFPIS